MRSVMTLPAVFAEVDVSDPVAVRSVLDVLSAVWQEERGGSCKVSEYRGVSILTFAPEQAAEAPAGPFPGLGGSLSVSFALFDDHLLLTTSPSYAKSEVRRRLSLEGEAQAPALLAGATFPGDVVELVGADWMAFLGRLYDTLRGLGPMLSQMAEVELPFDPAALPESTVFTRFFEPTVRFERVDKDGRRFFESSSFGPELQASLLAGALFGWIRSNNPQVVFTVPEGIEER